LTFAACGRTKSVVFPVLVLQITLMKEVERRLAALDHLRAVPPPLNNGLWCLWAAVVSWWLDHAKHPLIFGPRPHTKAYRALFLLGVPGSVGSLIFGHVRIIPDLLACDAPLAKGNRLGKSERQRGKAPAKAKGKESYLQVQTGQLATHPKFFHLREEVRLLLLLLFVFLILIVLLDLR
jgi:hypothetical protein